MRRRVPLISLLLAAALLAGQALFAVHDSDHGLQPGASHGCVVCVYAHGAGHGAIPIASGLTITGAIEPPHAILTATPATVAVRLHPIRGPPALLS